jgi:hypothetical protein
MPKLIISSGDTGDVDGFFALAEYSKVTFFVAVVAILVGLNKLLHLFQTGADVLFVMNYPRYVEETANDPEFPLKNPGLGFQYSSEQVIEHHADLARVLVLF